MGALDQGEDLLCPLAQDHPLICEGHFPGAFGAADEQLFSQFLLQPLQLGGEGGLGEVQ